MNISDLSIEGLTQLEARMTTDLEMVKRVKALVVEYQKMGGLGLGMQDVLRQASASAGPTSPPVEPGLASTSGISQPVVPQQTEEELLLEGLAAMPASGFVLGDLSTATYKPNRWISKDDIKSWVKRMVRQGKIRVVETRPGRIGSVYASNLP